MRFGLLLLAMFALVGTNRVGAAFEIPCAQQCGMEAEQAYHQCREQGGDEDECKAGAAQTFESCIATNCNSEPQDCQATCADVAMSIQNECLGACTEGEACAALCQRAHDVAYERCSKELCGSPDPGCGDDPLKCCLSSCTDLAHGVFADCIAVEGEAAKDLCTERARQAFGECAQQQCDQEPEVPCADRCAHMGSEMLSRCMDMGKPTEVCDAIVKSLVADCVDEHCADPGPTCEERCQSSAEGAFLQCVASGGVEDQCRMHAESVRDECVAAHCGTPDPTCTERCTGAVDAKVAACILDGQDEAFCKAQGDAALRHCVDEHCDAEDAPDPTCEERCIDHERHEMRRCLADGGTEEDCRTSVMADFQRCLVLHCSPDEGCLARCDHKAARAKRRCLRSGQDEAACEQVAADVATRCAAERCAPTPPDTCQSDCEAHADEVEQDCLGAGTPKADCAAARQGVLDQCMTECGAAPDETCTETCEDVAQTKFDVVLENSGDEGKAGRRGQRTFRRCERTCD